MFFINEANQKKPIAVWLENIEQIEEQCLEQAINLSNLPFAYHHIALMPDTHCGYGMPIGGVLATEDVVIPNAVGVDIGCGMIFVGTNIMVADLKQDNDLIKNIVREINNVIPIGFQKHKTKQLFNTAALFNDRQIHIDNFVQELEEERKTLPYQIGTLGGGNHFIELQEDENGQLGIMLHSGSRNFGYKVANFFNKVAKDLNKKWYSQVPDNYQLAFLPVKSQEGESYIYYMNVALDFAAKNRERMMEQVISIIQKNISQSNIEFYRPINAHHNYVSIENHYHKDLWIHRKGAISAKEGEKGIVPGSMGSYSFIVNGKGNYLSFCSCSHGAGRKMSRKAAKETISAEKVSDHLKNNNVILNVDNIQKVIDESVFAYKDINFVMSQQADLITIEKTLKTIGVIKGT
jgi:tRNA-splicing ligase RtcB (3'-phosphate/5'-hydroxy nucleic acid ligase)